MTLRIFDPGLQQTSCSQMPQVCRLSPKLPCSSIQSCSGMHIDEFLPSFQGASVNVAVIFDPKCWYSISVTYRKLLSLWLSPCIKKKSGLNSTESRLCVFMFILIKQHILGSVRSHFRSLTCDLLHSISKRERERLPDSWIGALGELLQTFHSPWALKIITCNRWSRWAALLLHPVTWERIPCKTIFSSCKHQILIEK